MKSNWLANHRFIKVSTLLYGLSLLQPPALAAESQFVFDLSKDWTTEAIGDGKTSRQVIQLRCRQETSSKIAQNSSSSPSILAPSDSSPPLKAVLLKDAREFSGASIYFLAGVPTLINENFSHYLQCGRPINLNNVQKTINEINTKVLKAALKPGKASPANLDRIATQYTLSPSVDSNGILSLEVVGKTIQDIQISTQCDYNKETIDTSGTVKVRGGKPDALIYRALRLGKGDRYPISVKEGDEIADRIMNLGLFKKIRNGFAVDQDPDKLTWIICVKQKTEAELIMHEAGQIQSETTVEKAKQAIAKYQEALVLMRQPQGPIKRGDTKKFSIMELRIVLIIEESNDEIDALTFIAQNYAFIGEYYQALNYYNQALSSVHAISERDREVNILEAVADIYKTLGDREQAHRYYEQALSIRLAQLRQQDSGGRKL